MPLNASALMQVSLLVSDLDSAADFYRALGLSFAFVEESGRTRYAECVADSVAIILYPRGAENATRIALGFRVDDIDDVSAALTHLSVRFEQPLPHFLRTTDPDGNRVHVSQPR
ncbi:VOC family protein [Candidatus Mycobacterium wuenschmannii]|uniref:VOC family protein n=1 Tax=Candidatus Mycobacterium wuenschmannii TaxID=3027808 RepID=A0ABY8VWT0_9MYCO|nr:VOC family protein [Candidatus Mycobacterium wuenschmannii]WIM88100.1 VOC family protein [Candidatus Mycobacterium wuenschmannii]